MIVMNYKCDFIKNMKWVNSYKNWNNLKQRTDITLLLLAIIYWTDKTMKLISWNAQTLK